MLKVGESVTFTLDHSGDPLGGPITIQARPGRIELTQGDAVNSGGIGPTPSLSPSP